MKPIIKPQYGTTIHRANPLAEYVVVGDTCTHAQPLVCLENGRRTEISFADGKPSGNWTVTDRVLSADELSAALALAEANRMRMEAERKAAAEVEANSRATERAELLKQYGGLLEPVQPGQYASAAHGAKNIRKQLKAAFPGVKFSVRSDTFSGGDSINVSWELGPTKSEVEAITARYQQGHFNGMEDIYEYGGSQWPDLFGGAKYVSASRETPPEVFEQIGRALCALQHVTYDGPHTRWLMGERDTVDLSSHVCQLMAVTSWPVGAVFKSVESTDDGESAWFAEMLKKYGAGWYSQHNREKLSAEDRAQAEKWEAYRHDEKNRHWCRIVFATPAQATVPDISCT